jgi:amino acid transporter
MSCFVMICALGGVNGLIFTVARVHATVGRDHPLLGWLGTWNLNRGVPFRSLVLQGTLTVLLIVTVGFETGRSMLDRLAILVEGGPLPWDRYGDGFSTLVSASAPVFWLFFLLNGLAVIVQRFRDPTQPRPFRVPGYPIPPLLFAATSGFMLYSSTNYAWPLLPFVLIPVLAGIPLYGISQWLTRRKPVHADVNRET